MTVSKIYNRLGLLVCQSCGHGEGCHAPICPGYLEACACNPWPTRQRAEFFAPREVVGVLKGWPHGGYPPRAYPELLPLTLLPARAA